MNILRFSLSPFQRAETLLAIKVVWESECVINLGTLLCPNLDDFFEKFQTAFAPPRFGKLCCAFCNFFLGSGTHSPPFPGIHCVLREFVTKICKTKKQKSAKKNWIGNVPPPCKWLLLISYCEYLFSICIYICICLVGPIVTFFFPVRCFYLPQAHPTSTAWTVSTSKSIFLRAGKPKYMNHENGGQETQNFACKNCLFQFVRTSAQAALNLDQMETFCSQLIWLLSDSLFNLLSRCIQAWKGL